MTIYRRCSHHTNTTTNNNNSRSGSRAQGHLLLARLMRRKELLQLTTSRLALQRQLVQLVLSEARQLREQRERWVLRRYRIRTRLVAMYIAQDLPHHSISHAASMPPHSHDAHLVHKPRLLKVDLVLNFVGISILDERQITQPHASVTQQAHTYRHMSEYISIMLRSLGVSYT